METKKGRQIKALKKASLAKHEATQVRLFEALKIMKEQKLSISFQSVAKFASVSKTWLYSIPEVRRQIEELRNKVEIVKRTRDVHGLVEKKEAEITTLREKIKNYECTIRELKMQLEVTYGELYKKNND